MIFNSTTLRKIHVILVTFIGQSVIYDFEIDFECSSIQTTCIVQGFKRRILHMFFILIDLTVKPAINVAQNLFDLNYQNEMIRLRSFTFLHYYYGLINIKDINFMFQPITDMGFIARKTLY